jgi:fatty acid synthase
MLGMQVVAEPTPWQGGTVAISNFGFGGSNVHCLVRGRASAPAAPPAPIAAPSPVPVAEGADSAPSAGLDPEVRSQCCDPNSVHRASTVP